MKPQDDSPEKLKVQFRKAASLQNNDNGGKSQRQDEKGNVFVEKQRDFFHWKTEGGPVVWQKAAWTPLVGG